MNKGSLTVDGGARIANHVLPPFADLHWTCLFWGRKLVFDKAQISSFKSICKDESMFHVTVEDRTPTC